MSDGSVVIDTELNNDGLKKDTEGLKGHLSKLGNVATTAFKGVTVAVGAAATAVTGLIASSVKATGELEQQLGGTEAVFKEFAKDVQGQAVEAYSKMGLSANQYMATMNKMGSLMQGSGLDIKTSMDLSSQAMQRAADVASIMGIDIDSAMESIAGAAKGNFTMMDNLGVAMNATTLEAYALSKGIKKSYSEMNNAQKVELAMQMFLEKSSYAMGNYTKENETFAGSLSTMKASIENFLSGAGNIDSVITSVTSFSEILVQSITEIAPRIIESFVTATPQIIEAGLNILTSLVEGMTSNQELLMNSVLDTITLLVNTFLDLLPEILETGIEIITQLVNGIAKQMPELVPMAIDCIILLVETLIDNLDLIIDSGIELILALIDGIIEALPRLIDKAPEILEKLVIALANNFPKIVKAGGELLGKLIMGITGSVYKLLEVAPKLIKQIVDGLKEGWKQMQNVGKYLIEGLWEGVSGMASWVADKVRGFASNILQNMKDALGIHSPSRKFAELGNYSGEGYGEGFINSLSSVYRKMKSAVDFETQKLSTQLSTNATVNVERNADIKATLSSIDENREIQIKSILNLDGKVAAETVNKVNAKRKIQYGIA